MLSQKEGAEKAWNQERQVGPILTSSSPGKRGMARSRVPWEEGEVTEFICKQQKCICNTGKTQHYKQNYYYYSSQQFDVSVFSRKYLRQFRTRLIFYPGMCSGRWFYHKRSHLGGLNEVSPMSSSSAEAFGTQFVPCGHRPCFQVCSLANLFVTPEWKLGVRATSPHAPSRYAAK